jgi:aminoglycoside phosphotransferase (APT) family kinase protein
MTPPSPHYQTLAHGGRQGAPARLDVIGLRSPKPARAMASSRAGKSGFPGELIGSGCAANVYALDAERVLRRYRTPYSCAAEAALMRYLRAAGYPVPEVLGADGPDLVMERLYGRAMLADMAARPWRAWRHARTLAVLHDRLHDIPAPPGLPHPLGRGERILHLDLHPGNVMLTADGPVVIDWTNASAGPPGADVAMAYLIISTADVDAAPRWLRPAIGPVRRALMRRFRMAVRNDPRPYLASYRIQDVNVRPAEASRLSRLHTRFGVPMRSDS